MTSVDEVPLVRRFSPGEAIAWRNCIRIDATRARHPSFAAAMTVVHDTDREIALYRGPGYPLKRRNAQVAQGLSHRPRHAPVERWLDGWSDETWRRWRVLVLKEPQAEHAISLFVDDATGALGFWYIDLIGPVQRRSAGFDYPENGLDIVLRPDLSSWEWKDVDEAEWDVAVGRFSRAEVDDLMAEGERAIERLVQLRSVYERWLDWRPDAVWPIPQFPPGWDEL